MKGYNPGKRGRPSHVYHTYFAANIRLVLDVEVQAGNQTASSYAQPEFWKYIDSLPADDAAGLRARRLWLGNREDDDRSGGTEDSVSVQAEATAARSSGSSKQAFARQDWVPAGQGWKGVEAELLLTGWSRPRRVIVLRRRIPDERLLEEKKRLADTSPQTATGPGFCRDGQRRSTV